MGSQNSTTSSSLKVVVVVNNPKPDLIGTIFPETIESMTIFIMIGIGLLVATLAIFIWKRKRKMAPKR